MSSELPIRAGEFRLRKLQGVDGFGERGGLVGDACNDADIAGLILRRSAIVCDMVYNVSR